MSYKLPWVEKKVRLGWYILCSITESYESLTTLKRWINVEWGLLQPRRYCHVLLYKRWYITAYKHISANESTRILYFRLVTLINHCKRWSNNFTIVAILYHNEYIMYFYRMSFNYTIRNGKWYYIDVTGGNITNKFSPLLLYLMGIFQVGGTEPTSRTWPIRKTERMAMCKMFISSCG